MVHQCPQAVRVVRARVLRQGFSCTFQQLTGAVAARVLLQDQRSGGFQQRPGGGIAFDATLCSVKRLLLLIELQPAIDQRLVRFAADIRIRGEHQIQALRRLREIALRDVSPGRQQVRVTRIRAVLGQGRPQ